MITKRCFMPRMLKNRVTWNLKKKIYIKRHVACKKTEDEQERKVCKRGWSWKCVDETGSWEANGKISRRSLSSSGHKRGWNDDFIIEKCQWFVITVWFCPTIRRIWRKVCFAQSNPLGLLRCSNKRKTDTTAPSYFWLLSHSLCWIPALCRFLSIGAGHFLSPATCPNNACKTCSIRYCRCCVWNTSETAKRNSKKGGRSHCMEYIRIFGHLFLEVCLIFAVFHGSTLGVVVRIQNRE